MGRETYTASAQVYLSNTGEMVYPGDKFTVDDDMPIGETWLDEDGEPISDKVRAANEAKVKAKADKAAGIKPKPEPAKQTVDYTKLKLDELRAIAVKRNIPTEGLDEAKLAEALRAADADG